MTLADDKRSEALRAESEALDPLVVLVSELDDSLDYAKAVVLRASELKDFCERHGFGIGSSETLAEDYFTVMMRKVVE